MSELHYNISLPDSVDDILSSDFWLCHEFPGTAISAVCDPVKFTSTTSIFVRSGKCMADIDLIPHQIEAPCVVTIRAGQILFPRDASPDFSASFVVMSKRLVDNMFMIISNSSELLLQGYSTVTTIPQQQLPDYINFYDSLQRITDDHNNPNAYQCLLFSLLAFYYHIGWHIVSDGTERTRLSQNRISDHFILLVQQHFKQERFLGFYADKLGITSKHLSRIVKQQTGYTAVEWIARYVILEAKVMLKSTRLTIQQIADTLNFPSQSLFGKYFKKNVGLSPKEFRNT